MTLEWLWRRLVGQPKPKVSWREPYWASAPTAWKSFKEILRPWMWLRITLVSYVLFGLIVVGVKRAIPQLDLRFLWKGLPAPLLVFAYLALMGAVHAAIPRHLLVRPDYFQGTNGQHTWRLPAVRILATRIVVFSLDRIRLRVYYLTSQGKKRCATFGVHPGVDIVALSRTLPVFPQIWDARSRLKNRPGSPVSVS